MKQRSADPNARIALLIFVAAKVLVLWFGVQAALLMTNQTLPSNWLEIWHRWDSLHYVSIAQDGYQATGPAAASLVFFPLFPWTMRIVAFFVRNPIVAGFVVSTVASLIAAMLLYRLAALDEPATRAREIVFFLAIFPTSYFLHIGYTESLFLALVLGSFYAARQEKWAIAGITGALAGLTRVNGSLLLPALAVEAFMTWRRTKKFDIRWLWIPFIAAGFGVYLLVNKQVAGSFFAFRVYQRDVFNHKPGTPWYAMYDAWLSIWERTPYDAIQVGWQEFLFTSIAIAVVIWSWMRLRASYATWATLNLLLWTSAGLLLGAPRYVLTVFPVFFCFARVTEERPVLRSAIVIWSLLWLAMFEALFVANKWAF
ncbi:MAG TPA: hypothetical protein VFN10_02685 [Thermoanaerobaculia bacterium]|nr:hypothetical protein [Thermoanaerobaculia bacterium]